MIRRSSEYVVRKTVLGCPAAAHNSGYCSRAVSMYVGRLVGCPSGSDPTDRLARRGLRHLQRRPRELAFEAFAGGLQIHLMRAGDQQQDRIVVEKEHQ